MPLHIAFFQAGYPVPNGTTTAVHGLALGLARCGSTVTIYGCGPREQLGRLPGHPNLRTQVFSRPSLRGFSLPDALVERLRTNQDQVDLLVINTMFNPPNVGVARAATKGRIPYVVSPHDPYHPALLRKNWRRKALYAAIFERPLLRAAAAVQVLAPEHVKWLKRFGVRTAIVIPNGFFPEDCDDSCDHSPIEEQELSGDPRFLCLGRADAHHKGLDLLVRAFASALHSGALPSRATLNFVGPDGGDLDAIRRLASHERVTGNVNFVGEVSDQTRRAMLYQCDMLLLCSRYDGFGLVILEAMLAGTPVIVSRQAGISSWVEKAGAGIIAEPSVPGLRAGLIEAVRRRDEWRILGRNGRSFAHLYMTWDQVAVQAAQRYSALLRRLENPVVGEKSMLILGSEES